MTNKEFYQQLTNEYNLDNNIVEYLDNNQILEIDSFDKLYEELDNVNYFNVEIIYYHKAMNYLKDNDFSLSQSLELADRFEYKVNQLNSELLATLLASEKLVEKFYNLQDKINNFLNK